MTLYLNNHRLRSFLSFFIRVGAQGETATLGDLQGLERDGINFDMVDGNDFNADKAYKDSKVSTVEASTRVFRIRTVGGI
jgi:hypothetical protein